jgi:hypothetical protein
MECLNLSLILLFCRLCKQSHPGNCSNLYWKFMPILRFNGKSAPIH